MLVVKFRHVLSVAMIAGIGLAGTRASLADWSGKGEAGIVFASGNTDTENANVRLELANTLDRRKHSAGIAAVYAATDDLTTGQRWEIYAQSDHNFDDRDFWFGATRYEDDRFSGFDYQASVSTGYGYRFIDTEETQFSGQLGLGYRRLEEDLTGATDSDTILRGDLNLDHALTDTARVLDKLTVEAGSDNTLLQNELSLEVRINKLFALSVGVAVRHNTDPPAGSERTDTLSTVNLVYSF